MNFIKSVFRGEKSLPYTFMLCYVLPLCFLYALCFFHSSYVITTTELQSNSPVSWTDNYTTYRSIGWVIVGILALILFGSGYAVIRSSADRDPMEFWRGAAFIVVASQIVLAPYALSYLGFLENENKKMMRDVAKLINDRMPLQIDEMLSMQSMSYAYGIVTTHFLLERDEDYVEGYGFEDIIFGASITKGLCQNWTVYANSGDLVALEFRLHVNDKIEVSTIDARECVDEASTE